MGINWTTPFSILVFFLFDNLIKQYHYELPQFAVLDAFDLDLHLLNFG